MLKKTGDVLYLGIDESNHGRFPEIFVAVASFNYQDTVIFSGTQKIRNNTQSLFSSLKSRDYRYLIVGKEDYRIYGGKKLMPKICSRLLGGFNQNYDFLKIFIDGEVNREQKKYLKEFLLEDKCETELISINQVPKGAHKKSNNIILLADGWANWIYKQTIQNNLTKGMRERRLAI